MTANILFTFPHLSEVRHRYMLLRYTCPISSDIV
jgi:hypothetical protein